MAALADAPLPPKQNTGGKWNGVWEWRAFNHIEGKGSVGAGPELSLRWRNRTPEEKEFYREVGRLAKRIHDSGRRPWPRDRRRTGRGRAQGPLAVADAGGADVFMLADVPPPAQGDAHDAHDAHAHVSPEEAALAVRQERHDAMAAECAQGLIMVQARAIREDALRQQVLSSIIVVAGGSG